MMEYSNTSRLKEFLIGDGHDGIAAHPHFTLEDADFNKHLAETVKQFPKMDDDQRRDIAAHRCLTAIKVVMTTRPEFARDKQLASLIPDINQWVGHQKTLASRVEHFERDLFSRISGVSKDNAVDHLALKKELDELGTQYDGLKRALEASDQKHLENHRALGQHLEAGLCAVHVDLEDRTRPMFSRRTVIAFAVLLMILLLLSIAVPLAAQTSTNGNTRILPFAGVPMTACAFNQLALDTTTGNLYDCFSGSWNAIGTGGGGGAVGPGTTDTVAKFTSPSAIGDSLMTDDGAVMTIRAESALDLLIQGYTLPSALLVTGRPDTDLTFSVLGVQGQAADGATGGINGIQSVIIGGGSVSAGIASDVYLSGSGGIEQGVALLAGMRTFDATTDGESLEGLRITSAFIHPGAAINNIYGLLIHDQEGGTVASYAIKTGLGRVQFGDTVTATEGVIVGAAQSGVVGAPGGNDYALSVQNNASTAYLEILNNGGVNKGAFFGMANNNFELWNYQGGPIVFFTDPSASAGTIGLTIDTSGKLSVGRGANVGTFTLDVSPSSGASPANTANFKDDTPSTGQTKVTIAAGANQLNTGLLSIIGAGAGEFFGVYNDGVVYGDKFAGYTNVSVSMYQNFGIGLGSGKLVAWTASATDGTTTKDTGMGRNGAGVAEINNGTLNTYRDLKLRDIFVDGQKCPSGQTAPITINDAGQLLKGACA